MVQPIAGLADARRRPGPRQAIAAESPRTIGLLLALGLAFIVARRVVPPYNERMS